MEKRKMLTLDLNRSSILTTDLATIIAFHNEGSETYTLEELAGYVKGRKAHIPHSLRNMIITQLSNELVVMSDGENIDIVISEIP